MTAGRVDRIVEIDDGELRMYQTTCSHVAGDSATR
jgi:hypothetical protein